MNAALRDIRTAARGAAEGAARTGIRRLLGRFVPRLAAHAVGHTAASAGAVLIVELGLDAHALARGRIDAETFRARATGAASNAAVAVVLVAAGAAGGPLLAAGLSAGLTAIATRRRADRPEPGGALEEHLERWHGGLSFAA